MTSTPDEKSNTPIIPNTPSESNARPPTNPASPTPNTLETLVSHLQARGLLKNPAFEAAFRAVPRHVFLPELAQTDVYVDDALPIKYDAEGRVMSSSSQPSMMLLMLHQLDLKDGHNVLEIGAGTGYNAAIMQHIVGQRGKVTTLEVDPTLVRSASDHLMRAHYGHVLVVAQDGAIGYSPRANYDRILCTAACWDIPLAWKQQLKPNGLIVAPLIIDGSQVSAALRFEQSDFGQSDVLGEAGAVLYSDRNVPCGFVPMQGMAAAPHKIKRLGSSGMTLTGDAIDRLDMAALHVLLSADHDTCHLGDPMLDHDIWNGLSSYVMLNHPSDYVYVQYVVPNDQQAYGMEGAGFGLVTPGSACLVPYHEKGRTHCFAGADAFLMVEELRAAWEAQGKPIDRDMRLRLIPKTSVPQMPTVTQGRVYERRDHYLHVWLAAGANTDSAVDT